MNVSAEELSSVFEEYFGLDLAESVVRTEIILAKTDKERFDKTKAQYELNLVSHRNRVEAAKRLYITDEYILYLQTSFPRSVLSEVKEESGKYYPICTIDEIKRIERPGTADDHLLRLRADSIMEHPRLIRMFLKRRELRPKGWSLTSYYKTREFDRYISHLPEEKKAICRAIPAGYILSREPHGFCLNTEFGKVVVLSESLKHFLYFMNVFMYAELFELATDDGIAALIIAVRTMLLTETPDFDIDPRGDIPLKAKRYCERVVRTQLQFIIGHEYAHALLGHFDSLAKISDAPERMFMHGKNSSEKWYNPRQQQEFDADAGSLLQADYSDEECAHVINAATIFFAQLELYYAVSDYINPPFNPSSTHPSPIDRIWALRKTVSNARNISQELLYTDEEVGSIIAFVNDFNELMRKEVLPFSIEMFERYGSHYLPTYRGEPLSDRFDY